MVPLVAATFLTAGFGLSLTPYVLAEDNPSPGRWTPMDIAIQIAGLGLILLATAIELRRRATRRLDTYREGTR